jgi:transcription elongation factor GreA
LESNQKTVLDVITQYLADLKTKNKRTELQQHLVRFSQWIGQERLVNDIQPSEIAGYGEKVMMSGPTSVERLQNVRKFLVYAYKNEIIEQNLAQHLRIRRNKNSLKNKSGDSVKSFELTKDGHKKLVGELEKLKAERAPIADEIKRAAADKDVRENAPLEAAREQLGHIESRIRQIESTLGSAVVIDTKKRRKTIGIGTKVFLKELNSGKRLEFSVVSSMETSSLEGKISDVSPVGSALMKKTAGQEIEVQTPNGAVSYKIMKILS